MPIERAASIEVGVREQMRFRPTRRYLQDLFGFVPFIGASG
jgi:hypothetical protein